MKAKQLRQNDSATYLKVVNNSISKKNTLNEQVNRININTLMPGFNYINHNGDVARPQNQVLL